AAGADAGRPRLRAFGPPLPPHRSRRGRRLLPVPRRDGGVLPDARRPRSSIRHSASALDVAPRLTAGARGRNIRAEQPSRTCRCHASKASRPSCPWCPAARDSCASRRVRARPAPAYAACRSSRRDAPIPPTVPSARRETISADRSSSMSIVKAFAGVLAAALLAACILTYPNSEGACRWTIDCPILPLGNDGGNLWPYAPGATTGTFSDGWVLWRLGPYGTAPDNMCSGFTGSSTYPQLPSPRVEGTVYPFTLPGTCSGV